MSGDAGTTEIPIAPVAEDAGEGHSFNPYGSFIATVLDPITNTPQRAAFRAVRSRRWQGTDQRPIPASVCVA